MEIVNYRQKMLDAYGKQYAKENDNFAIKAISTENADGKCYI